MTQTQTKQPHHTYSRGFRSIYQNVSVIYHIHLTELLIYTLFDRNKDTKEKHYTAYYSLKI